MTNDIKAIVDRIESIESRLDTLSDPQQRGSSVECTHVHEEINAQLRSINEKIDALQSKIEVGGQAYTSSVTIDTSDGNECGDEEGQQLYAVQLQFTYEQVIEVMAKDAEEAEAYVCDQIGDSSDEVLEHEFQTRSGMPYIYQAYDRELIQYEVFDVCKS